MTAILGVHGIAKQWLGPDQILSTWKPAVRDGVVAAIGRPGRKAFRPRLNIAFYGGLYRPTPGSGKGSDGAGTDDSPLDDSPLNDDEVEFLSEIENDVVLDPVPDTAVGDPVVTKGLKELPRPLGRLATWLDRRFGAAAPALFIGELRQVRRYQRDHSLAQRARDAVAELLPDVEVVVAHSLGSLVALEALALTPGHTVKRLVTIGSPLALPTVVREARVQPTADRGWSWTNIWDPSDPVTCAGGLAVTWPPTVDVEVDNGSNPHAAERYLCAPETGFAITGASPR